MERPNVEQRHENIEQFLTKANIRETDAVLDLGTGDGCIPDRISSLTRNLIVTVDRYGHLIDQNRRKYADKTIQFVTDDMKNLGNVIRAFPDRRFDVITCCWAFGYIPSSKYKATLEIWKSLLSPGGRIVLVVKHHNCHEIFNHVIVEAHPPKQYLQPTGTVSPPVGEQIERILDWCCATEQSIEETRDKVRKIAATADLEVLGSIDVFPVGGIDKTADVAKHLLANDISNKDPSLHCYIDGFIEREVQKVIDTYKDRHPAHDVMTFWKELTVVAVLRRR